MVVHFPPPFSRNCTRRAGVRRGASLVELLVVIAIVGALAATLLPAVGAVREAARRSQCQSRQREIGLGILNFESARRVFPPSGWTRSGLGNPAGVFMGWRTVILPHLEQAGVSALYDIEHHWWEGTNPTVAAIPIPIYTCPSTPSLESLSEAVAKPPRPYLRVSTPLARADHEAIQGVQPASVDPVRYHAGNRFAVMHRDSSTRHAAIIDGTSHTIMVVEAAGRPLVYRRGGRQPGIVNDQGIGWADSEGGFSLDGASPDGRREGCGPAAGCTAAMNARNDNEPFAFHVDGVHALFADGRVAFIHESIALETLAALCTRAAGDGGTVSFDGR